MKTMDVFPSRVRERRKLLRLSMEELGQMVGVARSTVQRWESGEITNVKRDKIARLADALDCSVSYLMGWDEEALDLPDPSLQSKKYIKKKPGSPGFSCSQRCQHRCQHF